MVEKRREFHDCVVPPVYISPLRYCVRNLSLASEHHWRRWRLQSKRTCHSHTATQPHRSEAEHTLHHAQASNYVPRCSVNAAGDDATEDLPVW